MLTIIAICLGVLTCTSLLVSGYLIFILSSLKKTIDEIEGLVVYIKGEIFGLRSPISKSLDSIGKITELINDVFLGAKTVKNKIIVPFAFILGIYAGIKAGLNVFLKGGDRNGK